MREAESRITRLNQEALELRTRLDPNDPVNTTALPGQQVVQNNNFGVSRQIQDAQNNFGDKLQVLEGEKISLMKRLNMVLSELEKATHEKSDISAKIREQDLLAEELKNKLNEVASLKNVVNRNLQEDLKFERDLNAKLREELDRFEREKETLISKLHEEEELNGQIQRDTESVNANLIRKTDDLRRLEDEHDSTQHRIRELNEQLDHLRGQEVKNRHQRISMDNELTDLTNQRNDLIRKMNELSERYDSYVTQMNRKRLEITERNKTHVKMLVAKLLVQILNENLHMKRKRAFQEIHATANQMSNLQNKLSRLHRILCNYTEDRQRFFLRLWYRKAFNVIHENYKRNSLIDANVDHMRRQKYFYKWRNLYNQRRKVFGQKVAAIKIVSKITGGQQDGTMRHYLCRWRDFVERRQAQDEFLLSTCFKRKQRQVRRAFVLWLTFAKRETLQQKFEILNQMVSETMFKQKVFLALKHACNQQRAETAEMKFRAWKTWCETARKEKYFKKKEIMVEKIHGLKTERLLKQVFDAIRFHNVQIRFEEARDELEVKIPEREALEMQKEKLQKASATQSKKHCMRQAYYKYCDKKYQAFMIWRDYVKYFKNTMQRFWLRAINDYKRRVHWGFMKLKEKQDKVQYEVLMEENECAQNANQDLVNEIEQKREIVKQQKVQSGKNQETRLSRIINFVDRKLIREFYDKWVQRAAKICDIDNALLKNNKTIIKHKLRVNFQKWQDQAKAKQRQFNVRDRSEWFRAMRERALKRDVFFEIQLFARNTQMAKRYLIRACKGIDHNALAEGFKKWKAFRANQIIALHEEEIGELQNRQEAEKLEIKRIRDQIESDQSGKAQIQAKMKGLSQRVMANYITRLLTMNMSRGFYTWLEAVRDFNQRRRFLQSVMNHLTRTTTESAFKLWAQKSYQIRQAALAKELADKESAKRKLIEENKAAGFNQDADIEDMKEQLEQAIATKEQLERKFEQAFNIWTDRKERNIYVNKLENIFTTWKRYVKAEKNAVNVIGAIVRRRLRNEVFQRIRLVGRERHLDSRASICCKRFFETIKHGALLKAFSRWRENVKKAVMHELQVIEEFQQDQLNTQDEHIQRIKDRRADMAAETIRRTQLRKVKTVMEQMLKFMRQLRIKKEILKQNVAYLRSKRATQHWFQRTQITLYLRRRNQQVVRNYKLAKMRKVIKGWKSILKEERKGGEMMARFLQRMQFFDQAKAFQHWNQITICTSQSGQENKQYGADGLFNILKRLVKRRLALVLHSLKMRTTKRDFKSKFLKRVFRHRAEDKQRVFFDRWKQCCQLMQIAEDVNTEGAVVMERNQLQRKAKAMIEQLQKMGYSPEAIQKFVDEKSDHMKQTMQRGIRRIFYKHSQFDIVPKAFNQMKAFVRARKLARENAKKVLNWMRNPLAIYFRRWKYDMADQQKALAGLSKQDLIDKIIQDEQLLGSKKSKLEQMNYLVENLAIQREQLLGHFIRGQKMALALIHSNYKKSIARSFLRWKAYSQECEIMALAEQLERTSGMIGDLGAHVAKLEGINNKLQKENEDLRTAAVDGIEIAKVVQEMTRQREDLSRELQDRAGTIKKLIEDNNNLSVRLNIAQREAQQLETMKQQLQQEPPSRDFM